MTRPIHPAVKLAATAAAAALIWLFLWPAAIGGSMTYVVVSGPSMEPVYVTSEIECRAGPYHLRLLLGQRTSSSLSGTA